jgi:NAD(P)-dependent dehydrogenase (short-subunit alcohol dehydrogenase family)
MGRLDGRTALVTGGAMGLGRAIAARLASDGATVVIGDVQRDAGEATASELGAHYLEQDVTDEARWDEVVADLERRFGQLDVLVNNAGILGPKLEITPENTPLADWRKVFAVNVEGVFLGCRAGIRAMRRGRGGSIVNLSSVAGLLATPYATAYGASKATVRQLTKSVAQHCLEEQLNVRCNSVHPGNVLTPLWERAAEEDADRRGITAQQVLDEAAASIPMGEWTRAEDIANAVSFLVSDEARHITGMEMIVDGGLINCDTFHLIRSRG